MNPNLLKRIEKSIHLGMQGTNLGLGSTITFYLLDNAPTTKYGESRGKVYIDPTISTRGTVHKNPKKEFLEPYGLEDSNVDFIGTIDITELRDKSLVDGADICTVTTEDAISFEGDMYDINKIHPKGYVNNVPMVYVFLCEKVR